MRILLLACVVVAIPPLAHGKCAAPGPMISPADGATIPATATTMLFIPTYGAQTTGKLSAGIRVVGGTFSVDHHGNGSDVVPFKLKIKSNAPKVEVRYRKQRLATYQVAKISPKTLAPRIVSVEPVSYYWPCSHERGQRVKLDGSRPIAYEAHANGRRIATVPSQHPHKKNTHEVFLGHLNCTGYNIKTVPKTFDLRALYINGTTKKVATVNAAPQKTPPPQYAPTRN